MKHVKKGIGIVFALLLMLSLVTPVMAAPARDAIQSQSVQGPNWNYLGRLNDGDWQDLYFTPGWGNNWQFLPNPGMDGNYFSVFENYWLLWAYTGFIGDNRFDIALRYDVTEAGSVYIAPWRHIFGTVNWGDGYWNVMNFNTSGTITATIMHNDTVLYTGTSGYGDMGGSSTIPLDVAVGDQIWFIVQPNDGARGNVLIWDAYVARTPDFWYPQQVQVYAPVQFGGNGVFSLRDAFMGATEHGPEWFFMSRYGDGSWQEMTFWGEWGGNNWQYTTNPHYYQIWFSMFDWYGVAAATGFDVLTRTPVEMAAAFRAPQVGTLRIGPWQHIAYDNIWSDGDYVVFQANDSANPSAVEIRHNDTTLYFQRLSGGMQMSPELYVDVQAGDMIYFIVRPMELENMEAGDSRVRMDDILVTFDAGVNFAHNRGYMPGVRPYDATARAVPASQPGDPAPGDGGAPPEPPAPVETPAPAATPAATPAPTPAPADDDGGFPLWAIIAIIAGVVVIGGVIFFVVKKK